MFRLREGRQKARKAGTDVKGHEKSGCKPLFQVFTGFASRSSSRAAKPARCENLKIFMPFLSPRWLTG